MKRIVTCPICHSQHWSGERCGACNGWDDERWALHDAREAFAHGDIGIVELERRIEVALTDPPRRWHPHLVRR